MQGQFEDEIGASETHYKVYEAMWAAEQASSAGTPLFAAQIHQLLGEEADLDALFLEESWTLGVPAALDRRQQRRHGQAERERQAQAFRELDNFGSLNFMHQRSSYAEFLAPSHSAAMTSAYGAFQPQQDREPSAPPRQNQNQNQDQINPASFPDRPASHSFAVPMTPQRACLLLGVTAASTREEIRAAYRRMASQCHPDRLREELRRQATDQMAEINQAYSLLCSSLREQAA
jgi:DnaJ-domain-containing protein 1